MKFEITAVRANQFYTLLFEAESQAGAVNQAKSQGYQVLSAAPSVHFLGSLLEKKHRFPLTLFSQELLALTEAGLSLIESIEVLAEKEHRAETKQVLLSLLRLLNEGKSIASAMELLPNAFTPLYVAALRAGEKTGGVSESLKRYISYQQQVEQLRKKIISASIYPAVLLVVGSLVILFLMGYVVPKFSQVYEDVGSNLPFLSQLMLRWGQLIEQHSLAFLCIVLIAIASIIYLAMQQGVRAWLFKMICKIPALGERLHIYQLSRFYRSLGMLLLAGIPIINALNMVSDLLTPELSRQLSLASNQIKEGQSVSQAMENHGLTTPISFRMLRVGERIGQMGEMMEKIAAFYDEETARWMDWFTKLFEPLLMLIMGSIIGLVVLMLYMPIFDLVGSV
jgi:general secretion pathway protein F